MAEATARPWRVSPMREAGRIWIEGPEGSAASDMLPKDRRVICDFEIVGDEAQDARPRRT